MNNRRRERMVRYLDLLRHSRLLTLLFFVAATMGGHSLVSPSHLGLSAVRNSADEVNLPA